jgi:hypothetical protein
MKIVDTETLPWDLLVPNPRDGDVYRKVIRAAEGGSQLSYDIRLELFGEGDRAYKSIRHRHDFEQLRFAVRGQMDLGFATLEEGQIGYFPAHTFYGPQECDGSIILIAQWGDRFITKADSDRAVAELSAVGDFTDGIYKSVDSDGKRFNKDPLNAIWEHVFQQPYVPQAQRYALPIVVSPGGFGWTDDEGPTRSRRLGVFTEHDLALEMVTWIEDGSSLFELADGDLRPTLLFTTNGSFTLGDSSFGALTGIWADPQETLPIQATKGSELLKVNFPAPGSRITLGLAELLDLES